MYSSLPSQLKTFEQGLDFVNVQTNAVGAQLYLHSNEQRRRLLDEKTSSVKKRLNQILVEKKLVHTPLVESVRRLNTDIHYWHPLVLVTRFSKVIIELYPGARTFLVNASRHAQAQLRQVANRESGRRLAVEVGDIMNEFSIEMLTALEDADCNADERDIRAIMTLTIEKGVFWERVNGLLTDPDIMPSEDIVESVKEVEL
jgi:hypothetical protein